MYYCTRTLNQEYLFTFFIVIGFKGCKRTEEKRKFVIHSPLIIVIKIFNLNNENNENDCKSSLRINHSLEK